VKTLGGALANLKDLTETVRQIKWDMANPSMAV
jgi:hypothetical protein